MSRVSLPAAALLLFALTVLVSVAVVGARGSAGLKRHKREWIIPPQKLTENQDYTKKDYIARIRSDTDDGNGNVQYFLKGVGASQYPFNLFVVNPDNGYVRVTGLLDREAIAQYNLSGIAMYKDGREAEKDIDLRIQVVDENDNPPVFDHMEPANVYELSPPDTVVTKVVATDADEPGNRNSMIAYSLVDQKPPGDMFYIQKDGTLRVKQSTLDREIYDSYVLTVKGTDLDGSPMGNTGIGTIKVNLLDVNDNPPTLEKDVVCPLGQYMDRWDLMLDQHSEYEMIDTASG